MAVVLSISLIAGLAIAVRGAIGSRERVTVSQELIDRIADQVAGVRELSWKSKINWRVVPPDAMRDLIRERQAEVTDQVRAELFGAGELIKYLRLFPPDQDLEELLNTVFEEEVAGFYDPEKDELVVVGSTDNVGPLERAVLAHELAHALVDQHFDLGRTEKEIDRLDDSERSAAFHALVEGDATLVTQAWASRNLSVEDMARMREDAQKAGNDALSSAPRIIRSWLEFPYVHGLEFVEAVKDQGGWRAVDDAYSNPPISTKQILHPEDFIAAERRRGSRGGGASQHLALPPPTQGCQTVHEGVMGEFDTSLVLSEFLDASKAKAAAEGWTADEFRFETCGGMKVFRATILTDSERDAGELGEAWEDWIDGWSGEEGNYPIPSSFVPGAGGGSVGGSGKSVSVILADDLAMAERRAA